MFFHHMSKVVIHTPALHPALAAPPCPEGLIFACPGLNSPAGTETRRLLRDFPFAPAHAEALLRELMELGLSLEHEGSLKHIAGQDILTRKARAALKRQAQEAEELIRFADSGLIPAVEENTHAGAEEAVEEACRQAHKTLLLAWAHEEAILEINALEKKAAVAGNKLGASLGEPLSPPSSSFDEDGDRKVGDAAEKHEPEYSWRVITDALAAFLPAKAVFFGSHQGLRADLAQDGLLRPLPCSMDTLPPWADDFPGGLLWTKGVLWHILGYAGPSPGKPWLSEERILLTTKETR